MYIFEESLEVIVTWCFVMFYSKGGRVGDFVS